jgi:uncharacterized protein (DUF305 family)
MDRRMHDQPHQPYGRLLLMAVLSFVAMYVLMYMMVAQLDHIFPNINQFYMAGLMTAPMVILELTLMGAMYPSKRTNAILIVVSAVLGIAFIAGIRNQAGVTDTQFLKSMITHHSGAILMCERARLQDPELRELCQMMIEMQREEIEMMQSMLQQ